MVLMTDSRPVHQTQRKPFRATSGSTCSPPRDQEQAYLHLLKVAAEARGQTLKGPRAGVQAPPCWSRCAGGRGRGGGGRRSPFKVPNTTFTQASHREIDQKTHFLEGVIKESQSILIGF